MKNQQSVISLIKTLRLPSNHNETEGMHGTFKGINNLAFQVVNLNSYLVYNSYLAFQPEDEQGKENTKEEETLRRWSQKRRKVEAAKVDCAEETDEAKKKLLRNLYISVLSSPSMLLLLLSHFLLNLGISSFFSFSPDKAIQFGKLTKGESSLLLSIIGVSNCVGRIVFGRLLDK